MKITLFDNYNAEESLGLTEDEYKSWCADNDVEPTDMDYWDWRSREIDYYWEDFECSLKHFSQKDYGRYLINGSCGLWYGRREIMPTMVRGLEDAIWKCINNMDYIIIEKDEELGTIEVTGIHHDGTNHFTIERISDEGSEAYEEWECSTDDSDFDMKKEYHLAIDFVPYC